MRQYTLPLIALAFAGCASATAPQAGDVPKHPTDAYPAEWRSSVAAYVKSSWKDPYSIRDAEIAAPVVEIFPAGHPAHFPPRWIVCLSLNAKNSFGAYTGKTMHQALIRDGKVLAVHRASDMGPACEGVKLEPFQEIMSKAV